MTNQSGPFRFLGFEKHKKKMLLEAIFNKESSDYESYFRMHVSSKTTLGGFRWKIMNAPDFVKTLELKDGGTGFLLYKMDGTDFCKANDDVKLIDLAPFKALVI